MIELFGRDLDAAIAERVLGWKRCPVGPDYYGENECEILTPDGNIPNNFKLPMKGSIHLAYFVPCFHSNLAEALRLVRRFGRKTVGIECDLRDLPTLICRDLLAEFEGRQAG